MNKLSFTAGNKILALCFLFAFGTVMAEPQKHNFNIAPQSISDALKALAAELHIQIISDAEALKGKSTAGIKGDYTLNDALKTLLAGSGLSYTFTADDAVAIKSDAGAIDGVTLPRVKVTSKAEYDVTDPHNEDYLIPQATSGTKTNTPIMETPFAVQTVSKQIIKDQQNTTLDSALKNVSGVVADNWSGYSYDVISLRGFNTTTTFRNGFRMLDNFGYGQKVLTNVEDIEVLKGPAAVLYGQVEPGGMVNIITKQPQAKAYYSLEQKMGSWDHYITLLDATGAITQDDTFLYRVNASFDSTNSWRQDVWSQRTFFAPTFRLNFSPKTQATFEVEYTHNPFTVDNGQYVPYVNNQFITVPRTLNYDLNAGTSPAVVSDRLLLGLKWSHEFNQDWSLKQQFISDAKFQNGNIVSPYAVTPIGNSFGISTFMLNVPNTTLDTKATSLDLIGHFNTGVIKHTLLLGADYYNVLSSYTFLFPTAGTYANPPVDMFNPANAYTNQLLIDPASNASQKLVTNTEGVYLQDQAKLPYDVDVTAGVRFQNIDTTGWSLTSKNLGGNGLTTPYQSLTANAFTPRAGLIWKTSDWLSLYGNYTESFAANPGFQYTRQPLKPSLGNAGEIGFKSEIFDGRLRSTLAFFDITKTNYAVPETNPAFAGQGFYTAIGAVNSKGIELDVQGEIQPNWKVILTYAHTNSIVTKNPDTVLGDGYLQGMRMPNIPLNMGSFWTTYDFSQPGLRGWTVGGGVTVRGNTTDPTNTQNFNAYEVFDLMSKYSLNIAGTKLTAQINVNNLLDKNYFVNNSSVAQTPNAAAVIYGMPRSAMGSIKLEF